MIAFLISELNICGGTHKQFLKLLEYTEKRGEDFYIITREVDLNKTYPEFQKYANRIRLFPFKRKSKSYLRKIWTLYKDIVTLRKLLKPADCVNIHDYGFGLLLPAFYGKKVYWQINDLPSFFRVGIANSSKRTLRDNLLKHYFLLFKGLVTDFSVNVTKNKERIKQTIGRDAHVFYCGIEPVGIERNIQLSLDRFHKKRIHLLSSGVFFPYRNYETQLLVVEKLLQRGVDVHLNIIGSTQLNKAYSDKIMSLIDGKHLGHFVTVCGQVDGKTFKKLHEDSDLFIFINVDQSWGLAVFEAMSCGLPVIVSKSVGATEILSNNENALFVDPMNVDEIIATIIGLMTNEEQYLQIVDVSRNFHNCYTWDKSYSSRMLNLMLENGTE